MRIAGAALAIAMFASVSVSPAGADPDPTIARADALFSEAQKLLESGNLEGACAKFTESLTLNGQAIGTLLNVARCDARLGKIAHAVALYTEARNRGREQNLPTYVAAADEQLSKLSGLVPHLAIAFVEPIDGMKIVVDDEAVSPSAAAGLAVDPGAHHIIVSSPGRVSFDTWVKLAKSDAKAISVPPLAYPTTIRPTHSSRRAIGKIVTLGGGVLLASGITIGVVAKSHYDSAIKKDCPGGADSCNTQGFSDTQSARSLGNVGTALGAVGLAVGIVGTVLWWRAPHDRVERGVAVAPLLGPGQAGIIVVGRF